MVPFDMEGKTVSPIAVFDIKKNGMYNVAMFLPHPKASTNVERCFFLRVDVYEVRHFIRSRLARAEEILSLGFSNEISPCSIKREWRFYEASLGEDGCYKLVRVAEDGVGNVSQYISRAYALGIWNWGF